MAQRKRGRKRGRSRSRAVALVRRNAPARVARRRGGYRRNPAIVQQVMQGVKDGLAITGGVVGVRMVSGAVHKAFVGDDPTKEFPGGRAGEVAVQLASAIGVGFVADRFLNRDVGRMMLGGGFSSVITSALVKLDIPFVSEALTGELGAYPTSLPLGAYPAGMIPAGAGQMLGDAAFPSYNGLDDDDD